MGLFDSLSELGKDLTDIVTSPIEVAVDTVKTITKPLADATNEIKDNIKETLEEGN